MIESTYPEKASANKAGLCQTDGANTADPIDVYVCTNIDCKNRGAAQILKELSELAQITTGESIAVKPYMCFSACNIGPNVVIPAKRCWLSGVRPSDVGPIVGYLEGGSDLPHLREQNEPDLEEMIFAIIDAGLIPE
ncbi:MAG: (2Fe-2S) ferredoxin domain-containing protein [Mesorhizobium sp.]|uniref:(2Fe-2S) ferredoxin domain-containing protein n=1 Tax=Mesorhizobium sp. TaxID=1871066 RepID=UPI00120FE762|nr:(2Fe-2S) ferredoxin domain-containing protein [Mesorhizobium sp.]TIU71933.1 MAG: (2Fe-2S) ferredoxin domain-containing protein [Mesorhizobium sp.]TIW14143.1 MAG: (2Fe-2S) ferredoxin domain-containing protein [Mesorhizobium sp.]TIW67780.1 MAG: (2Fe-2S) ferredoxin domain-containing protein [Mesorhizobium sp.]TIX67560.1 MAG: (2Fe-2S) ferredoxin domain-containing protein [Mesorhizobium sp.]